jgi:hypothetical protein
VSRLVARHTWCSVRPPQALTANTGDEPQQIPGLEAAEGGTFQPKREARVRPG